MTSSSLLTPESLLNCVSTLLNGEPLEFVDLVQSLWSGYGQIVRMRNINTQRSYVVKAIAPASRDTHPRGWNTPLSHQRKLRSYEVETRFYQHFASHTDEHCAVPRLLGATGSEHHTVLVMEDLDSLGYSLRKTAVTNDELHQAIRWLAFFHGKFWGDRGDGLWATGSYWHLATRSDEWEQMPSSPLKQYASDIDQVLNTARYQTLVHGDAKLANLCFADQGDGVAAVDFQYVGRGSGVKDLAYLLASACDNDALYATEHWVLTAYIDQLFEALSHYKQTVNRDSVTAEIQRLYPFAWADFYRFLLGWNQQSPKISDYMRDMSNTALTHLAR